MLDLGSLFAVVKLACFEQISVESKIESIRTKMREIWPLKVSTGISTRDNNCTDEERPAHTL